MNEYYTSLFEEDGYTCNENTIEKTFKGKSRTVRIRYIKDELFFFPEQYCGFLIRFAYYDYTRFKKIPSFRYDLVKGVIDCYTFLFKKFRLIEYCTENLCGHIFPIYTYQVSLKTKIVVSCVLYSFNRLRIKASYQKSNSEELGKVLWQRIVQIPEE